MPSPDHISTREAAHLLTAAFQPRVKLTYVEWLTPNGDPRFTGVDPERLDAFLRLLIDVGANILEVR